MTDTDGIDLLVVEDDPEDANTIERMLVEFGNGADRAVSVGSVQRASRLSDALDAITDDIDIALLDLSLPDSQGIETVASLVDRAPHVPIVVITGSSDTDLGPEAIKIGAQDYLRKGRITDELLHRSVRYAIDRHEQQREIVTLNRRLALLNRVVAQDIRTDVNVVVGRGDELRERVDPEQASLVDSLLEAAHNTADRTNIAAELLSLLSPEDDPGLERLDIGRLVEAQADRMQDRHDVSLSIDRGAAEGELIADVSPMLRSAFEQLLSNAIKHNDRETPEVAVTIESTSEVVTVEFADDGVGISDTQKRVLNDPDRRYHEQSGIGTGLYLVTTVLEQSGGTIEFSDRDPEGTVVAIELPRGEPRSD